MLVLFEDVSYKVAPRFLGKSLTRDKPSGACTIRFRATKTLTTVLHVILYTLTQIFVSRLATAVATGGTTLNVAGFKTLPKKVERFVCQMPKLTL